MGYIVKEESIDEIDDMWLSVSPSCVLLELHVFCVALHLRALFSFVAFM
jgi:hypothetical protein